MLDMDNTLHRNNSDTAAANTVTQITLPALAKPSRWSIGGIAWSYDGIALDTSAGLDIHSTTSDTTALSTADSGSTLVFSIDINDDGAGFIIPAEPFKFRPGNAIRIRLLHGGLGHQKLNVLGAKVV